MKHLLMFAAVLAAGIVSAQEFNIKGDFAKTDKAGIPVGWYNNVWGGYQPAPKYEVIAEGETKVLHVSEVKGKYGFSLSSSARQPAVAGDTIVVTARVKGTGRVTFGLQGFTDKFKWIAVMPSTSLPIEAEWKDVKVELKVVEVSKTQKVGAIMVTFGGTSQGELFISNLKAEKKAAAPAPAPAEAEKK